MAVNNELLTVADLDPLSPQFTWKAPVIACNPGVLQYTYSIRIVEMLPGQLPDNSMDQNPVVYQVSNLSTPMCMIPQPVIKQMKEGTTYAAQVTATTANANNKMLNYVSIANSGKSTYKLFRLKASAKPEVDKDKEDQKKDDEDDEDDEDNDIVPKGDDIEAWMGDTESNVELTDSLYTFRNPRIISPAFSSDNGARKMFVESDILVNWELASLAGGEGQRLLKGLKGLVESVAERDEEFIQGIEVDLDHRVADSDPEKEYMETVNKSKAIFEAARFAKELA